MTGYSPPTVATPPPAQASVSVVGTGLRLSFPVPMMRYAQPTPQVGPAFLASAVSLPTTNSGLVALAGGTARYVTGSPFVFNPSEEEVHVYDLFLFCTTQDNADTVTAHMQNGLVVPPNGQYNLTFADLSQDMTTTGADLYLEVGTGRIVSAAKSQAATAQFSVYLAVN